MVKKLLLITLLSVATTLFTDERLHKAAILLLELGADPSIRGNDGLTPYEKAVKERQTSISEYLISHQLSYR